MMGEEAFILLKAGWSEPETPKQAEIRVAILPKILRFARFDGRNLLAKGRTHMLWLCRRGFRKIWLIYPESHALLFRSQFWVGKWRSILQGDAGKRSYKYRFCDLYHELHEVI
jgi:hypothetical protein